MAGQTQPDWPLVSITGPVGSVSRYFESLQAAMDFAEQFRVGALLQASFVGSPGKGWRVVLP